jgi:hypothetical protein
MPLLHSVSEIYVALTSIQEWLNCSVSHPVMTFLNVSPVSHLRKLEPKKYKICDQTEWNTGINSKWTIFRYEIAYKNEESVSLMTSLIINP